MDHKVCAQYGLTRHLSLKVFSNISMLLHTLQLIYNRKMTKKKSKSTRAFLFFGNFFLSFNTCIIPVLPVLAFFNTEIPVLKNRPGIGCTNLNIPNFCMILDSINLAL
jgi:hypothetical protein